ncbi:MAG: helix-turn-helix transcriptional regulator [Alphaproteobacteria bacterium]|nr:helix-turn-helix transcriptional regulator [Alphaproteobacteria bacterium]
MVESNQIRAARAMLNWSQTQLAEVSKVSLPTIKRMEQDTSTSSFGYVKKVREALEKAGLRFTESGGVEPKGK